MKGGEPDYGKEEINVCLDTSGCGNGDDLVELVVTQVLLQVGHAVLADSHHLRHPDALFQEMLRQSDERAVLLDVGAHGADERLAARLQAEIAAVAA